MKHCIIKAILELLAKSTWGIIIFLKCIWQHVADTQSQSATNNSSEQTQRPLLKTAHHTRDTPSPSPTPGASESTRRCSQSSRMCLTALRSHYRRQYFEGSLLSWKLLITVISEYGNNHSKLTCVVKITSSLSGQFSHPDTRTTCA